jgi:hypothetical protein
MKKIIIFCASAFILCAAGAYAQNNKKDEIFDEIIKVTERKLRDEQNLNNIPENAAKYDMDDLISRRKLQKNIKRSERKLKRLNKAYDQASLIEYYGRDYKNNIFYLVNVGDIEAIKKKIKKDPSILEEKYEDTYENRQLYFLNYAIRWKDLDLTKVVLKYSKNLKYNFAYNPAWDAIDNVIFSKKWTSTDLYDILFNEGLYELLYDEEGKELKSDTLWYFLFFYPDYGEVFDALVSRTPNINYRRENGYSFLNLLDFDKPVMAKTLLDAGIEFDVYKYPEDMATYMEILAADNTEMMKLLTKYGKITKNVKLSYNDKTNDGNNILHLAAAYDNVKIIDDILKTYADNSFALFNFANDKNERGFTPIEYAVFYNRQRAFEKLIVFTPIKYNQKVGSEDKTYLEFAENATNKYPERGTYILDYFKAQQKTHRQRQMGSVISRDLEKALRLKQQKEQYSLKTSSIRDSLKQLLRDTDKLPR